MFYESCINNKSKGFIRFKTPIQRYRVIRVGFDTFNLRYEPVLHTFDLRYAPVLDTFNLRYAPVLASLGWARLVAWEFKRDTTSLS